MGVGEERKNEGRVDRERRELGHGMSFALLRGGAVEDLISDRDEHISLITLAKNKRNCDNSTQRHQRDKELGKHIYLDLGGMYT